MLKVKNKEKNSKAARRKQFLTHKETPINLAANISEMIEARMQWLTCSNIERKD